MDEFANDAITYERVWSVSSWTLPATISLLSGVYPFTHGVMQMGQSIPTTGMPWLPGELARLGYETAGFWQWLLGRSPGVERGFGTFALDVQRTSTGYLKSPSEVARGMLWQYLFHRPDSRRPLFAYLHVCDPHAAYEPKGRDRVYADRQPGTLPPELYTPQIFLARGFGKNPADTAHLKALYEGEVRHADREFGAFLDLLRYLGLYEDSLIVLVADHGEEFYEHGGFEHSRTLYNEVLDIPLIVKFPGRRGAGVRIPERVTLLDVAPTILRFLGESFGNLRLQGRPLPQSAGQPEDPRSLFAELLVDRSGKENAMDLGAAVQGGVKCIFNAAGTDRFGQPAPHFEAFDLRTDSGERFPLEGADPRAGACRDELTRWIGRAREVAAREQRPVRELPAEEVRRLRALGYVN
jgi:arylsulfatase A-like enzyme